MLASLLKPLAAPVAAVLGILLTVLYLDRGWKWALCVVLGTLVGIGVLSLSGWLAFKRWPYGAGFVLEAGLGLLLMGAALGGAVLLWVAIKKAPGAHASSREKEVWAAASAALTAYLGALIIKPEGKLWNPVKNAIKRKFKGRFGAATDLDKDARDAVLRDNYGAIARSHEGDQVDGWGWHARRLRTGHIQDRLLEELDSARQLTSA